MSHLFITVASFLNVTLWWPMALNNKCVFIHSFIQHWFVGRRQTRILNQGLHLACEQWLRLTMIWVTTKGKNPRLFSRPTPSCPRHRNAVAERQKNLTLPTGTGIVHTCSFLPPDSPPLGVSLPLSCSSIAAKGWWKNIILRESQYMSAWDNICAVCSEAWMEISSRQDTHLSRALLH